MHIAVYVTGVIVTTSNTKFCTYITLPRFLLVILRAITVYWLTRNRRVRVATKANSSQALAVHCRRQCHSRLCGVHFICTKLTLLLLLQIVLFLLLLIVLFLLHC